MDKKEIILKRLKNSMLGYIRSYFPDSTGVKRSVEWVVDSYKELNEKDNELEDLINFYYIKGRDCIDEDIITNNYKVILPCFNIYKSGGIEAVNNYLRNIPSNIREEYHTITDTDKQTTTDADTTKEQKIVITDTEDQTTTDLKEKIVKCFFAGKYGADFYIKSIQKQYDLCDEKDQELEKLIDFYWSMENDIINIDLEKDINYKDILSCIPIYKENGIKGVEEYLGKEK